MDTTNSANGQRRTATIMKCQPCGKKDFWTVKGTGTDQEA